VPKPNSLDKSVYIRHTKFNRITGTTFSLRFCAMPCFKINMNLLVDELKIKHWYSFVLAYFSYFKKIKRRLMRSPCCPYVCVSVCVSVFPPRIFSFPMRSVSYQRKVCDYFLTELLVC
jgi:hypothetical protein